MLQQEEKLLPRCWSVLIFWLLSKVLGHYLELRLPYWPPAQCLTLWHTTTVKPKSSVPPSFAVSPKWFQSSALCG